MYTTERGRPPQTGATRAQTSPRANLHWGARAQTSPRANLQWEAVVPRRMASTTAAQEPPRSSKALPQMSQESPGAREPSYVLSPWREAGRRKLLAAILFMTSLPGSNSASGEPPERPGSRGQERSLAVLPGSRGQERSLAVLSGSRGQERSLPQCTKDLNLEI